ncbi:MAG: hypothetical protein RLY58_1967 [Pseudomonadota bacterium]|jgi:hypothetical protein
MQVLAFTTVNTLLFVALCATLTGSQGHVT